MDLTRGRLILERSEMRSIRSFLVIVPMALFSREENPCEVDPRRASLPSPRPPSNCPQHYFNAESRVTEQPANAAPRGPVPTRRCFGLTFMATHLQQTGCARCRALREYPPKGSAGQARTQTSIELWKMQFFG